MSYRKGVVCSGIVLTLFVSLAVLAGCDLALMPVNGPPTVTPGGPTVTPTPTPISQERRVWAIRQAKDAASQFSSSPRIHNGDGYQKYEVDMWPDDAGSTTIEFFTGGGDATITPFIQPMFPLPSPTPSLMILSTLVSGSGADIEVTFECAWGESNRLQHHWRVRVAPDGHATLIEETGAPLPEMAA